MSPDPIAGRWSWTRGPLFAALLFVVVLAGGTIGYVLVEGWTIWDAFYMTVTTVATVGFREVHPLSFAGELFTVLLIVGGVGTVFYTVTLVVSVIVEGGFHRRIEQRRFNRMLEQIKDHYIVCGYGRIGSIVAQELAKQRVPFVVLERDPARVHAVVGRGWMAIEADASQEHVLKRVGVDRARGLIAAVGTDAENVYTVLTARGMNANLFIVARVESDDAEHKLRRAGADRVISPYQIGAAHIVQTALRPTVVDFVDLATNTEHLELSIEQVHVHAQSPVDGRTLVDAGIRQKFGVIVVAIKRASGAMEFNPPPEAVLHAGDELVVVGKSEQVKALEETVAV